MRGRRLIDGTDALAREGFRQASEGVRATQSFRFPPGPGVTYISPPEGAGPSAPPPISTGAAGGPILRDIAPPWREKLGPVSQDFSRQNFELILAAGAGQFVEGPTFQLAQAQVGWLQQMQQYVLSQSALTSVSFALFYNGGPVPGFEAKRNFPGVANILAIDINGIQSRIPQGALISSRVTNLNANGPWTVGIGFAGWFHSLQAELDRWGPV